MNSNRNKDILLAVRSKWVKVVQHPNLKHEQPHMPKSHATKKKRHYA